jgi:head-tail adaptor
MSDIQDQMRRDTPLIVADTSETINIRRRSIVYNDKGESISTWSDIGNTAIGDVQPLRGARIRAEAHLEVKSDFFVILPYDTDILADDRVYRTDNTFLIVNYLREYEGHITAFLTFKKGVE